MNFCIFGFDPSRDLTVTIDDGAGARVFTYSSSPSNAAPSTVDELFDPSESGELDLAIAVDDDGLHYLTTGYDRLALPGSAGRHTITVRQGDVIVSDAVEVVTGKFAWLSWDDVGVRPSAGWGDTLTVAYAGLPPGSELPLALYRRAGTGADGMPEWQFVEEVVRAPVNAQGWGSVDYVVPFGLEPVSGESSEFCIVTLESIRPFDCADYAPIFTLVPG